MSVILIRTNPDRYSHLWSAMRATKEIYFHIGLGKTGTTFLQYRAFPQFDDLEYIQRTRFRNAQKIINASAKQRFFISYECDQQLERVAREWARSFPETIPIIVFREHGSWIASQYRRFVKNCHVRSFHELLDLYGDSGLFKKKDLEFYPMIELLESLFNGRVIVLLYKDLRSDPQKFIADLAHRMNSNIDLSNVDFSKKHSSYSEKQLRGLMATQKYINLTKKVVFKNRGFEFFRKSGVNGLRYLILFISKLLPESWFDQTPLIPENELEKVDQHFAKDWQKVLARANRGT